ncbi:carbon-nitrogen hydrolase family protein [Bacillus massiliigorillae]|uniref:carbon-nitrogen hydrolase family protein n=1 Tax=Bacillus massiliigorillae TaxID=1243664 RepID=UPI00039AC733|nr:carbon-nitrogen hydrolase family protein [Bacillus massiliigorillae]
MRVSIAQLSSSLDKDANLKKAEKYIEAAKKKGADIVVLPEMYMALIVPGSGILPVDVAEPLNGPFVEGLREAARKNNIYVVCGIFETKENAELRAYNTTVFIDRTGKIIQSYRKTHLYDAFNYVESDTIVAGDNPYKVVDTEFGKIGLMVCYEIRFPEIARQLALQGADMLIIPAGWVKGPMKEEHWQVLLKARAIENTVFIVASNQVDNIYTGRSMILDPMGVALANAGEEETLITTDIDYERIAKVRGKLPSVKDRRPKFYAKR